jgi:hypothetical protein
MPTVNAEAMNEHLKEISTQVSPGAHAILVCDGAGWHQSGKRLRIPNNITLLPLPPYSPELNPMENIWDYRRGNKLSRLVWDSYEAIVAACKDAWDFLVGDPERIKSIALGHRSMFRVRQETNASTRPSKVVTRAKARVQKSRGRVGPFAILDARLREHDEAPVDSLIL